MIVNNYCWSTVTNSETSLPLLILTTKQKFILSNLSIHLSKLNKLNTGKILVKNMESLSDFGVYSKHLRHGYIMTLTSNDVTMSFNNFSNK